MGGHRGWGPSGRRHQEGQLVASPCTLGLLAGRHWAGRGHPDGGHPKGAADVPGVKVRDVSVPPPEAAGAMGTNHGIRIWGP